MFKSAFRLCCVALILGVLGVSAVLAGEQSAKDLFAPVFVNRPSKLYFSHCDTARYTFQAVSAATGLPSLWVRYHLLSGPGTIDSVTGEWKLGPVMTSDSIGEYELEVGASELGLKTEGLQDCHVGLRIEDYLYGPYPSDGEYGEWIVRVGVTGQRAFRYGAESNCGTAHSFFAGISPSFAGYIAYQDNNGTSVLSCRPDTHDAGGYFSVRVGATDDLDTTFYNVPLQVPDWPSYSVRIKSVHNQIQGIFTDVPVVLETHPEHLSLGGFDFLFAYDNSVLALQTVSTDSSGLYRDCKWEYFTYRFGANGDCSSGCPSGLVRVVGLAETNNGSDTHPQCGPYYLPSESFEMFRLHFLVSNDHNYNCSWIPIRFFWLDCGDNITSTVDASVLSLESTVWDVGAGGQAQLIDSSLAAFPGYAGIPPQICGENVQHNDGRLAPVRRIDFYNGGIDLICAESIDARGDINLNGLAYEMADYGMLANYFVGGNAAFGDHAAGSLEASDVNVDEVRADVADLVYLWRVIFGEAVVNPPLSSSTPKDTISVVFEGGILSVQTPTNLGALRLVFDGKVRPSPRLAWYPVKYDPQSDTTVLLVYPALDRSAYPGFGSGAVLDIEAEPGARLMSASAATREGFRAAVIIDSPTGVRPDNPNLPVSFALHQNYPNPFNGGTTIKFDLPKASDVTVDVLNILGQVVWSSTNHYAAGSHQIEWNAAGDGGRMVSSGVYYYRLKAGSYTETKKMVLLK